MQLWLKDTWGRQPMSLLMRSSERAKPRIISKSTSVNYGDAVMKPHCFINKQAVHIKAGVFLSMMKSVSECIQTHSSVMADRTNTGFQWEKHASRLLTGFSIGSNFFLLILLWIYMMKSFSWFQPRASRCSTSSWFSLISLLGCRILVGVCSFFNP